MIHPKLLQTHIQYEAIKRLNQSQTRVRLRLKHITHAAITTLTRDHVQKSICL